MKDIVESQGMNRTPCVEDGADLELRDESLYISCMPSQGIHHFHYFHASNAPKQLKSKMEKQNNQYVVLQLETEG